MNEKLKNHIITFLKNKNVNENSINNYINNVKRLSESDNKNFDFLNNVDDVLNKIQKFKPNTQRNYIIAIVSCLSTMKDKTKYNKLYLKYREIMDNMNKELKSEESQNKKTETQKDNWEDWDTVIRTRDDLKNKIIWNSKKMNNENYINILKYVVLSLFTMIPVRRNKDYVLMHATNCYDCKCDSDSDNYFDIKAKKFIFNNFKNVKKTGPLTVDVPNDLYNVLIKYLKVHPLRVDKTNKKFNIPLLVHYNGEPLNKVNGITYLLNSIFGKKLSSSMLRHIYLSKKYSNVLEEQKKDALMMSHNSDMQKDYIKL